MEHILTCQEGTFTFVQISDTHMMRGYSASRAFPFNAEHYGRVYKTKEVTPIFVEEADRIVIITVYTFFSQRSAYSG